MQSLPSLSETIMPNTNALPETLCEIHVFPFFNRANSFNLTLSELQGATALLYFLLLQYCRASVRSWDALQGAEGAEGAVSCL